MIVEDVADEGDEENQIIDNEPKLEWYLIDTERNFAKVWNFLITLIVIYNLIATPFFLVFPGIYRCTYPCIQVEFSGKLECHQHTCDKGDDSDATSGILR